MMTRTMAGGIGLALLGTIGAGVAPASADPSFGRHVSTCVQTMGFDAEHNPGMHQGYAGWSPDHHC